MECKNVEIYIYCTGINKSGDLYGIDEAFNRDYGDDDYEVVYEVFKMTMATMDSFKRKYVC